jgi:oxysterol-binding protein 1
VCVDNFRLSTFSSFATDISTTAHKDFRNQEEEGRACRGSVALKYAMLKPTSSTRFDIQSVGHDSRFPKWNLQASHPQEMANWSQAIRQHIEYYKDGGVLAQSTAAAAAAGGDKATLSVSTRRPSSTLTRSNSLSSNALFAAASAAGASLTPIAQEASPLAVPSGSSAAAAAALRSVRKSPSTISLDDAGTIDGDADEDEDDVRKVSHLHLAGLPHEDKYEVHAQTVKAQLEVADQLLDALVATGGGPIVPSHLPAASSTSSSQREPSVSSQQSSSLKRSPSTSSSSRQQSVKDSLRQSLKALSDLLTEYQGMSADREQWLIERYQHEVTTRLLWEQSMQETARQHADMERVLHEAAEKNSAQRKELRAVRMSTIHAASPLTTPTRESVAAGALMAGAMLAAPTSIGAVIGSPTVTASSGKDLPAMPVTPVVPVGGTPTVAMSASPVDPSDPEVTIELPKVVRSGFIQTPIPSVSTPQEDEEEEEDEFFDAVESGTLPLQIAESILHPVVTDLEAVFEEAEKQPTTIRGVELNRADYEPYGHLRSRLPINSDARPAVSLWAILKSSIGKDLTKISFPVFFNEPTSMLERMAEDMEFSECLDAAAADRDSLKRLAYVAAFAMSNYSSTEGRIAKPFNPMLGETYEYCRLDKKFRYVSEQVSHHPPISACWAESPKWRYYGEVREREGTCLFFFSRVLTRILSGRRQE